MDDRDRSDKGPPLSVRSKMVCILIPGEQIIPEKWVNQQLLTFSMLHTSFLFALFCDTHAAKKIKWISKNWGLWNRANPWLLEAPVHINTQKCHWLCPVLRTPHRMSNFTDHVILNQSNTWEKFPLKMSGQRSFSYQINASAYVPKLSVSGLALVTHRC